MSVFRPLLIGNYSENGTVHNSCFFRTFPVSLGLYYKGRQFAVGCRNGCGFTQWGVEQKSGLHQSIAHGIFCRPPYIYSAHIIFPKTLSQTHFWQCADRLFQVFWSFGPEGVKLSKKPENRSAQCLSVGRIIKQILTDKFKQLVWRRVFFVLSLKGPKKVKRNSCRLN